MAGPDKHGITIYCNYLLGTMVMLVPVICCDIVGKDQVSRGLGIARTIFGCFTIVLLPIWGMYFSTTFIGFP